MTILTDPVLATTLQAAGTENNPFVAHQNKGADATVTTAVGTEQNAAANAVSGVTYNFWRATPNGSNVATLQFVFASNLTLDFVGLAAHNLGTIGATVKVQYSLNSGGSWLNSAAGEDTPSDDQAIGFRFAAVTADYWRIEVSGITEDAVIGIALLSEYLTIPQRIYQGYTPPLTPTQVDLQSNVSEGGHLLGSSAVRKSSTASVSLTYLDPTFVRGTDWLAFQTAFNEGEGFFWAWRPEKYGDLFFAWRSGGPIVPQNSGPHDLMGVEMGFRCYDNP